MARSTAEGLSIEKLSSYALLGLSRIIVLYVFRRRENALSRFEYMPLIAWGTVVDLRLIMELEEWQRVVQRR